MAVRLVIHAGPKIRLGRLRFFGNKWTKDNVLRRQFRRGALPGDYLDIEALEGGRNRLLGLRYFSVVRFGDGRGGYGLVRDPGAPEDVRDVEVEIEETDTRQFQIGAGVSTDGGAFAQLSVTWRNFDIRKPPDKFGDIFSDEAFRGAGQSFTISLRPGSTFSSFTLAFSDPAVRDSRYSLSTSLARRLALYEDYDQISDEASVRVGRFLDRDFVWNLSFKWAIGQVILEDPEPDAPQNAIDQQGANTLHRIGFTLVRTKRREVDAFLNGHVSTFDCEFLGGFLGGHWDVIKLSFEHRAGWRVFQLEDGGWNRILLRFRTDWATPFGDSHHVPIFERYFLGGRSLRGFAFREVGPRDNGRPTGGDFLVSLALEYTYPITSREDSGFGLDLVFFLDQGTIASEIGSLTGDDWRISAGFGLAIGFGGPAQPPLIIDFGWPIRDRATDERQVLSVAFVRNF
jgi:outer membrane protein assembly factor BamA